MNETKLRSTVKTMVWKIAMFIMSVSMWIIFTGDYKLAFGVPILGLIISTIAYYTHERIWNKIKWGIIE